MRLKNIKLAGFKSFVDPTNVRLTSNMVAVIGPNGCGKSNIIDAVRWVMGESSAKNLRGESMADVIFNGSTARKPVGQASIELVFDNEDGTLGGEYAGFGEISLKRMVTRDGQSRYFINNNKCRRRDITDIFLGTGLGPRSYAIIEQGMISRLIESKPEELRVFIEEAAGISKYKERRRETETRIRHTRENLERLTDVRDELERQIQRLKRQAASAKKYKEYKEQQRVVKAQTHALQWQFLRDQSSGQREEITRLELSLEESIAGQRGIDARIEELRQQHTEKTDQFNEVQAEYYGLGAQIARVEQSLAHQEQRSQQLREDLAETDRSTSESTSHLNEDQEKLARWEAEIAKVAPQHEELTQSESQSSAALRAAEGAMQEWQQRWDKFNEDAAEPQKHAEVERSRIEQIEQALHGLGSRLERLRKEFGSLDTGDLQQGQETQEREVGKEESLLLSMQNSIEQCNRELKEKRDQLKAAVEARESARSELVQLRGRVTSLESLQSAAQADIEGDNSEWLRVNRLDKAPRLLEQLHVQEGWETAFEAVLGDSLQALSVDRLEAIAKGIERISDHSVSFVEPGRRDGKGWEASASVVGLDCLENKAEGDFAGNMLDGIYACDDLTKALAKRSALASGESIVTRDGIWIGANWLRVVRKPDARSGFIARRKELDKLARELKSAESQAEQCQKAFDTLDSAVVTAEQNKDRLLDEKSLAEKNLSGKRSELSALVARIDQLEARHKRIDEEISHAEKNRVQQEQALATARENHEQALEAIKLVEGQRQELLLERDTIRDQLTEAKSVSESHREALQEVAVRNEALRAQIESVRESIDRLQKQLAQLQQRKSILEKSARENEEPVPQLRTELEEQLQARLGVEAALSAARGELEAIDTSVRDTEQQRTASEQKTEKIRTDLEKLRIDSQSSKVRLKTIEEQLQEEGFDLQAVQQGLPEDATLETWQQSLEDIGRSIERLGAINLAAIEEFETESERKKYLDAQNDELESALQTLESAIQKIDRQTRSLFKETFDKLNDSLKELFPRVFGGGNAYLEMTGEDLLDTGIAIMARPPGKRNSTIHLLSGGEKALTAIALVFSIFQLNPAPFCMLDEVDAPLDDANTARYARMVKDMSDKVQFIFITHNKITMEMADHLMGVTMQEPGVSRMVSVDIDEAVQLAAS